MERRKKKKGCRQRQRERDGRKEEKERWNERRKEGKKKGNRNTDVNVFCLAWKGVIYRIQKHQAEFLFSVGTKRILMSISKLKISFTPKTVGNLNVCNLNKE